MTGADMATPVDALSGYTVGITAARRREELGAALERRGARVVYGPAIRIVPLSDDTRLLAATRACLAAPLDFAVATTGVGFRGWMDAAESWGLAEALLDTLGRSIILTRGPKVRGAVRARDLREEWSPDSESSPELLQHMTESYDLAGKRVAVQLHGEPLRELVDTLRGLGADVIEVPVYRWEPPEDEQPLLRLIDLVASAGVDALTFTSAPAALNFLATATARLGEAAVHAALAGPAHNVTGTPVLSVAVGPVTAAPLLAAGIPVCSPARFRLGALVREVVERLPARAPVCVAGGRRIELRGHAALVDGTLVPLPASGIAMLKLLASSPGRVYPRAALAELLPGEGGEGHAVDSAIGRLRTGLGDPGIVQTVVKRGYRLAVDA